MLLFSLGLAVGICEFPVCAPLPLGISRYAWGFPVGSAGDWEVEQGFGDVVFERRSASGRRS